MLKFLITLFPIFFLLSCQSNISQIKKSIEVEKLNQDRKRQIKTASIDFGLYPLENISLPENDLEIRYYRFGSGYIMPAYNDLIVRKSVLILRRIDSNWSVEIIRDIDEKKVRRISERPNFQQSDLENLYQKLNDENIANLTHNQDGEIYPDATLYAIETNINNDYDFTYSQVPNEAAEEEDSKQIAKLFNIVAKEFEASDFQALARLLE
ncbi:MAG: hypothetical protein K1X72_16460 [Pyrinomonadaceae bacterium]|nr:hypothetical protein [Pyrinomonadaceae bacterium]